MVPLLYDGSGGVRALHPTVALADATVVLHVSSSTLAQNRQLKLPAPGIFLCLSSQAKHAVGAHSSAQECELWGYLWSIPASFCLARVAALLQA